MATENGSPKTSVDKRIRAAKEAFYGMGNAWNSGIHLGIKSAVFKGLVANTLLSGLEAETLRTCDLERLEKCLMNLARRVRGKKGVYEQDGNPTILQHLCKRTHATHLCPRYAENEEIKMDGRHHGSSL